jgi:predicted ATPase
MLRNLRLHPYKVHRDISLNDVPPLSVVVGRNNSGKSALLHAIALPKYGIRWDSVLPTAPFEEVATTAAPPARIDLDFGSQHGPLMIEISLVANGTIQWRISDTRGGRNASQQIPAPQQYGRGELNVQQPEAVQQFFLAAERDLPARSFTYQAYSRDIGPAGEGCWNALHQLKADDNPAFERIRDVLTGLGFGMTGLKTPTVNPGSGAIRIQNYGRADVLPFMGSGLTSVLPIVTQGILCRRGETFLVEEPELHLHRSALDALAGFFGTLTREGVQVMMTSHSTAFFPCLKVKMDDGTVPNDLAVYILERSPDGGTSVVREPLEDYYRANYSAEGVLRRSS